jgi:hypothetical protein
MAITVYRKNIFLPLRSILLYPLTLHCFLVYFISNFSHFLLFNKLQYFVFLCQWDCHDITERLPWYNWNIVESGVKHHKPMSFIIFYFYFKCWKEEDIKHSCTNYWRIIINCIPIGFIWLLLETESQISGKDSHFDSKNDRIWRWG